MNSFLSIRRGAARFATAISASAAAMLLSACQFGSTGTDYFMQSGAKPEVTSIVIDKSARNMDLYNGDRRLRRFKIDLGFQPEGHKTTQGDGRTPEGTYFIDRKNPASQVTSIVIDKSARNMDLYNGDRRLLASRSTWDFSPKGTKPRRRRTNAGTYFIDRKNPASQFYLSLGISYPNSETDGWLTREELIRAATSSFTGNLPARAKPRRAIGRLAALRSQTGRCRRFTHWLKSERRSTSDLDCSGSDQQHPPDFSVFLLVPAYSDFRDPRIQNCFPRIVAIQPRP